ncbi:MAG: 16S rRNA (cytidine(1402)-2'-O)-methyltransferase [Candidatus Aminicenantes bacterium]|nr:16S rRNA (cytidine(1402)-2'-O)-methyltransferase [Candidatus Aminicenantes bacterium]
MTDGPAAGRRTGTLFVVATPIGNLEDITLRALRILGEAGAVACEDTRQTLKLMNRHGLRKRLISYFHPHEGRRLPEIIGLLKAGIDVALVSDAGTPGLADPGFPLIREALKEGVPVVPVPGPSAAACALSASGLPTHRFMFLGFPPPKKPGVRKLLRGLRDVKATLVFYLPTRRIAEFLAAVLEELGDRRMVIARELTKVHEEFIRGRAGELLGKLEERALKGEATVLVEGE